MGKVRSAGTLLKTALRHLGVPQVIDQGFATARHPGLADSRDPFGVHLYVRHAAPRRSSHVRAASGMHRTLAFQRSKCRHMFGMLA
ncbi:hypothetical protein GCM10018780_41540 [Streptomyces lanatus]|nr:hypothetical protein GCM10018780_41540 [Streptomyces lanatus]